MHVPDTPEIPDTTTTSSDSNSNHATVLRSRSPDSDNQPPIFFNCHQIQHKPHFICHQQSAVMTDLYSIRCEFHGHYNLLSVCPPLLLAPVIKVSVKIGEYKSQFNQSMVNFKIHMQNKLRNKKRIQ